MCLSYGTAQMVKQTTAPWGRHSPSTCHKSDEGRGDDLCFLEKRRRSSDLACASAAQGNRTWLSQSVNIPSGLTLEISCGAGSWSLLFPYSSGTCRRLQVCRSELLLRKGLVGFRGENSRGLPSLPCPAGSGQSIVQPGFQTRGSYSERKGKRLGRKKNILV